MNTEINLRLGNEREIKACIENASVNIAGFENEFRVMSRGEGIFTGSYRELPIPIKIPLFDDVFVRTYQLKLRPKTTRLRRKR